MLPVTPTVNSHSELHHGTSFAAGPPTYALARFAQRLRPLRGLTDMKYPAMVTEPHRDDRQGKRKEKFLPTNSSNDHGKGLDPRFPSA